VGPQVEPLGIDRSGKPESGRDGTAGAKKGWDQNGGNSGLEHGSSDHFQRGWWTQLALGLNALEDSVEAGAILAVRLRIAAHGARGLARRKPGGAAPAPGTSTVRPAPSATCWRRHKLTSTGCPDQIEPLRTKLSALRQNETHRTKIRHAGPNWKRFSSSGRIS
jgi:hypothetical protein